MLERPVIGALGNSRKKAGGHFPVRDVISETIAAPTLARARFIAAVACAGVAILFAVHDQSSTGNSGRDYLLMPGLRQEPDFAGPLCPREMEAHKMRKIQPAHLVWSAPAVNM
jgi:hypothetical protein